MRYAIVKALSDGLLDFVVHVGLGLHHAGVAYRLALGCIRPQLVPSTATWPRSTRSALT